MGEALKSLLGKALRESGLDRRGLVDLLPSKNRSKSFRRLDRHLSGEVAELGFLKEIGEVLGIPFAQIETAMEYDRETWERECVRCREKEAIRWFERTGPHLWVILPKDYHPSLIAVLGPEFFLLVPVPQEVIELPDYEQFQQVGAIARAHFSDPKRRVREVAGYRFRRSLEETFEFSTEGDCLGRKEGPPSTSVVSTRFRGGIQNLRRVMGMPDS